MAFLFESIVAIINLKYSSYDLSIARSLVPKAFGIAQLFRRRTLCGAGTFAQRFRRRTLCGAGVFSVTEKEVIKNKRTFYRKVRNCE
ncbi:MAG: hypothetical protein H7250_10580 [Flavobacterium sp.]|nr:hypothetical protein [Flavobacterium sp.]